MKQRKKRKKAKGQKKKYAKNEKRNILPNAIGQLFSFLERQCKSKPMVNKVLSIHKLERVCSVKKYYVYQRFVKSKLPQYLTEDSLDYLFEIADPLC